MPIPLRPHYRMHGLVYTLTSGVLGFALAVYVGGFLQIGILFGAANMHLSVLADPMYLGQQLFDYWQNWWYGGQAEMGRHMAILIGSVIGGYAAVWGAAYGVALAITWVFAILGTPFRKRYSTDEKRFFELHGYYPEGKIHPDDLLTPEEIMEQEIERAVKIAEGKLDKELDRRGM